MPNFTYNLISASKLVAHSSCFLVFFADCVIQALPHNVMIGRANLVGGLYNLHFPIITTLVAIATSMNKIWHSRLGHLSLPRLTQLAATNPCIVLDDHDSSVCDACHLGKQRRLSFPLSHSTSKSLFDLIHVDIWEPLATPSYANHRYFLTIVDDFSR